MKDRAYIMIWAMVCFTICFMVHRLCTMNERTTWKEVEIKKAENRDTYWDGRQAGELEALRGK